LLRWPTLKRRRPGGFTLLEMVVVLLVVGLVAAVSVVGLRAITSARLREEAGRLAAVIRATYALAVTSGRAHRLVFDLDASSYSVEVTEDPVLLAQEKERAVEGARVEEDEERPRGSSLGIGPETPRLPRPGWRKVGKEEIGLFDTARQEVKLPGDVLFDGVFTTHQVHTYTRGRCELYFFPQGWTEGAIVYLKEKGEAGETFSLEVDALTARVTLHPQKIAVPPELLEDRGQEEEGEKVF
jgi:type II secretion system protein H